ncbi:MAG: hypothetical protein AABZ31_04540 [Bdellovibrionota bacterium]
MSMNLPPQAYTRETLMMAFDWIRSQPKNIQELASTSDALVSIYMQARRRGGQYNTTPVSSQSFKQDLKNLAEGLKQFDGAEQVPPTQYQTPVQSPSLPQSAPPQAPQIYSTHPSANMMPPQMPQTQYAPPPQYPPVQALPNQSISAHHPPVQHYAPPTPTAPPTAQQTYYAAATPASFESEPVLDAKSLDAARRVQARFNLSSENEAVRLLIALGFEKVREMAGKF